ncbi:YveK family protein [Pradoshia sp.]
MDDTISFKEILNVMKRRLNLIILMTLTATLASGIISYFFLSPMYESSTQILVNHSTNSNQAQTNEKKSKKDENEANIIDPNQVRTNIELINTYTVLIKSPAIIEKVIGDLSLDATFQDLNERITLNTTQNSQVVEIVVQDKNPAAAADIANHIAEVFKQEVAALMSVDNINILTGASEQEPYGALSPDMIRNIMIGFALGLFCAIGTAFLLEYLDPTIRNERDIVYDLGIPIIGNIPEIKISHKRIKDQQTESSGVRIGGRTLDS